MTFKAQLLWFIFIIAVLTCGCTDRTEPRLSDYNKNIGITLERKISALKGDVPAIANPDVEVVNKFVNSYIYIPEKEDYWKLPDEFYADGGGDCEDYAIVKYHALKATHKVAVLVGSRPNSAHAVLLVDGYMVLDNQYKEIRSYSQFIKEYKPEYVADSAGIRYVVQPASDKESANEH